ncbi:transglycosylase family protein [Streptomyces lunalinharesii]|uniref:Resuscitation-promoting factor protein RpfC n=1 Tax=Streptomyces lunalinharesii TaxID=333384 RepID=A0ABP6F6X8_9ACTN
MTGAGLALPLFTAGGAQAADASTWDRVAQCESGGVWSAATGNGFYGGVQLTQEMWDDYGGSAYASRPDLASRAQQIAVAEAILDDRGPDAFPSCAVKAGLTKGGRKPAVDPGATTRPAPRPSHGHTGTGDPSDTAGDQDQAGPAGRTPAPSDGASAGSDTGTGADAGADAGTDAPDAPPVTPDPTDSSSATPAPSDSATPGDSPSGKPSDPASPSPSDPADPGAPASPSDSAGPDRPAEPGTPPAAGKHRGTPDDGTDPAQDRDGGSGRHASRGGETPRTPPAKTDSYRVRAGDNLSAIADRHDLPGGWPALYHRNQGVIGADADLIHPGQLLDLGRTQG